MGSAQELDDTYPFQDHPANKDIPGTQDGLKSGRIRRLLLQQEENERAKSAKHSVWLGRLRKTTETLTATEEDVSPSTRQEDVEELLHRFTPRLRALLERSALKERGDDSLAAGNAFPLVECA